MKYSVVFTNTKRNKHLIYDNVNKINFLDESIIVVYTDYGDFAVNKSEYDKIKLLKLRGNSKT